jgi:hypothetical protein
MYSDVPPLFTPLVRPIQTVLLRQKITSFFLISGWENKINMGAVASQE